MPSIPRTPRWQLQAAAPTEGPSAYARHQSPRLSSPRQSIRWPRKLAPSSRSTLAHEFCHGSVPIDPGSAGLKPGDLLPTVLDIHWSTSRRHFAARGRPRCTHASPPRCGKAGDPPPSAALKHLIQSGCHKRPLNLTSAAASLDLDAR